MVEVVFGCPERPAARGGGAAFADEVPGLVEPVTRDRSDKVCDPGHVLLAREEELLAIRESESVVRDQEPLQACETFRAHRESAGVRPAGRVECPAQGVYGSVEP